MKHLFRLTAAVTLGLVLCIGQVSFVSAQKKDYGLGKTVQATGNLIPSKIGGADTVPELIGVIVSSVLGFLGILFFFLIFYGGLVWMTAQGSEEKIERSKEIISAAVVGLVIVLAAYAFTRFIFDQLAARNGGSSGGGVTSQSSAGTGTTVSCGSLKDFKSCFDAVDASGKGLCTWEDIGATLEDGVCVTAK